jgi:glycosyltransferase involved in cell wall biosynthesis
VERREPMRILLVAPQPFYTMRGTPIAVRLVVRTLCEAGHEVHLLVYHAGDDIEIPGMKLFRAGRPPGVGRVPIGISAQKLACDVYLVARMVSLVRRYHYDVIHAVEEAIFPAALIKAFMPKPKLIYDMDSSLSDQLTDKWRLLKPLRPLFETLERQAVSRSSATLAVCESLAAKVRPWAGAERVTVLPDIPANGSASEAAADSLRDFAGHDATVGLYVGNLERYQGIDLLFDSMLALDPNVPFRMVVIGGEQSDVQLWQARAELQGLAGRLHFLGKRPLEQLGSYLEQADVLVSPRVMGTNTPMKISCYLQAGKAILATNIYSHTQMLDSECAVLVHPTPADVAAGLRRLVEDPALRVSLGAAAQAKAERECSPQAFRTRLLAAYERVLMAAFSWFVIDPEAVCQLMAM